MKMIFTLALAAVLTGASLAAAQQPVTIGEVVTKTFTIVAIDHTARIVTLKDKDGAVGDVYCGPEVQRFDALNVGDEVTFRYHESLVSAISRPGETGPTATTGVTRTPGSAPGGTLAHQMKVTVVIEAVNPNVPSVTVKTADGTRMSFAVADKKYLEGYKPGDTVTLTYTQALAISVAPAK